ncbi:hypothetical protein ABZ905_36730 [Streptomyces parvus]|uniref:hypothetical protein n=1 Tax=Streptomyces parvus TaxID=66428 RepID=UPI0033DD3D8E
MRYYKDHPGDRLGRDDWITMRSEEAADGRVTLVLVDWVAGIPNPTVTRAEMPYSDAVSLTEETQAELLADGWRLDTEASMHHPWG